MSSIFQCIVTPLEECHLIKLKLTTDATFLLQFLFLKAVSVQFNTTFKHKVSACYE